MGAMWAALQFLTICPWPVRRSPTAADLGRAVGFFPLVGLLLGAVLAATDAVLVGIAPDGVRAVVVVALWMVLTGGLHYDGLLDTCDGLLGGRTVAERLRIMRDERVGALAVAGGVLLLLAKHGAVAGSDRWAAVLMAPVVARWAMAVAIVRFPYARQEGLGRTLKDHAGRREVLVATVITVLTAAAVAVAAPVQFGAVLAGTGAAVIAGAAAVQGVLRRLPGLTGDVYGALAEVTETVVLLVAAL